MGYSHRPSRHRRSSSPQHSHPHPCRRPRPLHHLPRRRSPYLRRPPSSGSHLPHRNSRLPRHLPRRRSPCPRQPPSSGSRLPHRNNRSRKPRPSLADRPPRRPSPRPHPSVGRSPRRSSCRTPAMTRCCETRPSPTSVWHCRSCCSSGEACSCGTGGARDGGRCRRPANASLRPGAQGNAPHPLAKMRRVPSTGREDNCCVMAG